MTSALRVLVDGVVRLERTIPEAQIDWAIDQIRQVLTGNPASTHFTILKISGNVTTILWRGTNSGSPGA